MNEPGVQSGAAPQMPCTKFASISLPRSLCTTSGWNCTPKRRFVGSRNAWIGAFVLRARTCQPSGSVSMRSPCDIQTVV